LSQKYLRNFWFRYLDEDKGWTAKRIDLTVDLIMKMLNYWPEDRPTCEELYKHPIFNEIEGEGVDPKPVLSTRSDFKDIEVMVKHSGDNNFRAFQGKLAKASSSLLMKSKMEADKIEMEPNISIHTILNVQEKIEVNSAKLGKVQYTNAQALDSYKPPVKKDDEIIDFMKNAHLDEDGIFISDDDEHTF